MAGDVGQPGFIARILAILIAIFGLLLAGGGIWLLTLGGTPFYAVAGLLYLTAGFLLYLGRPVGAWLTWLAAALAIVWALVERGANFWAFFPRVLMPLGIACAASFLPVAKSSRRPLLIGGLVSGLAAVVLFAAAFFPHGATYGSRAQSAVHPQSNAPDPWYAYGRTNAGTRFAPFTAISRDTISKLKPAWTYRTGDIGPGVDQNTPLQIGNLLYSCSRNNIVAALDLDTGKPVWKFDPKAKSPIWQRCRSVSYYQAAPAPPSGPAPACAGRIVMTTIDARLIELDAATGRLCADFGNDGTVQLSNNMGTIPSGSYFQTSAPLVARDRIVIGGWVVDNQSVGEPSGVIRAFDARTGALVWAWDLGNPAITREPPPGQTYTRGTPNMWTTAAYDDRLGLIYAPLGNSTPDYFGAHRSPQSNAYNSSLVAIDVETGRDRWHFQTVHYDLWDYDLPSQPALVDVTDRNGVKVPAVLQATKRGQLFLLNRETGQPIADVVEKPVPANSPVPGEKPLSPTQPYSVGMPTIGAERLDPSKAWGMTILDQLYCRIKFHQFRYEGDFTPTGFTPTIQQPGNVGGMNWGSASVDPASNYAYVNDIRVPSLLWLTPRAEYPALARKYKADGSGHGPSPQAGTPYGMITLMWMSPLGVPCTEPPFGTLSAVDLNTRKIAWQVPVGTAKELGPLGIKLHLPMPIGMPTYGGTATTAGGLVFFAGSQDYYLRAYDAATGREVWKYALPIGSSATPMTYVSPATGRQYVVISVGGAGHSADVGDYVMAFAL